MEEKAFLTVNYLMSGCERTPKLRNHSVFLCLFLEIKDAEYYTMESLMIIIPLKELKLDDEVLSDEFELSPFP